MPLPAPTLGKTPQANRKTRGQNAERALQVPRHAVCDAMIVTEQVSRNETTQMELSSVPDLAANAPCVALVPLGAVAAPPARIDFGPSRPDPRFVTQLIAMAQLSPQTRLLRRATQETAQAAYRLANRSDLPAAPGRRTRQVA